MAVTISVGFCLGLPAADLSEPAITDTIAVRADVWPPFTDVASGDRPGSIIAVAQAAFAGSGIAIDYQVMPWAKAISSLAAGTIDAIAGADGTEVPDIVLPTESSAETCPVLIGLATATWRYDGLASFAAIKLGYPRGYTYNPELNGYFATAAREAVIEVGGDDPLSQAVALLERGRIMAYLEDDRVFFARLPRERHAHYVVVGKPMAAMPVYLAFAPGHPRSAARAAAFSAGVARLRSSGQLASILVTYNLTDWKTAP